MDGAGALGSGSHRRCRSGKRTWRATTARACDARRTASPRHRARGPSHRARGQAVRAPVAARDGSDGEEVAGAGVGGRVPQLRHGPCLDLADPLAGQVEVLPDLLEGPGFTAVQPEPELQDLALPLVER